MPTLEAREKTHPVKQDAVFSQKVNPAVAKMIPELVADGITEIDDVKKALRHRINHYTSAKILHQTQVIEHTSQRMMT